MSVRDLIKKTINEPKKPKRLRLVALEGSAGESTWRDHLKGLLQAPILNMGMESQEMPVGGDTVAPGLTVAVMSPKDSFTTGLSSLMQAAANGEPSQLLVGILESDGEDRFTEEQTAVLKPLTQLIADRNGTFVCDNLDKLADEANHRLHSDDYEEVPLKSLTSSGNYDSAMN